MIDIIRQIAILALIAMVGFIARRRNYVPENTGPVLSKVIIRLTVPFLIITNLAGYQFTSDTIYNGLKVYFFGLAFMLFSFGLGHLTASLLGIEHREKKIFKLQSMFGNIVFLGFPLLDSLFGQMGIVYAMFYYLANDTIIWTLGIFMLRSRSDRKKMFELKNIINSSTVSFVIGILFILFNIKSSVQQFPLLKECYDIFMSAFTPLGKSTIYLSMLFIGFVLAEIKVQSLRDISQRSSLFVLAGLKLVVYPVLALAVLLAVRVWVEPEVAAVILLEMAMPCGTMVAILASEYGADYKYASEAAFVSTLFSVATIPIMVYVLSLVGIIA